MQENDLHKFTLLPSYYEAAMKVPEGKRNEFIAAIFCYGLAGDEQEFSDPMLAAMFELVRPLVDQSVDYHRAKSEAGKQGGRGHKKTNKARESTSEQSENTSKQIKAKESNVKADQSTIKAKESKPKRESSLSLSLKGLGVQGEGGNLPPPKPTPDPPPCVSQLTALTPELVQLAAKRNQVSYAFAASCLTRLHQYCRRTGKNYEDYFAALEFFITSDREYQAHKVASSPPPPDLPPKRAVSEAEIAAMRAQMPEFLQHKLAARQKLAERKQ